MKLHAEYRARTHAPDYAVHVRCLDSHGESVNEAMFTVADPVNADKLVNAIKSYGDRPTPTKMNWVASRLRSVPAPNRKQVLSVLDNFAGFDHE